MRHERLGIPGSWLKPQSTLEAIEDSLKNRDREGNEKTVREMLVFECCKVAGEFLYLDKTDLARHWAERVVEYADDFFFGSWRDRALTGNMHDEAPDRKWWDENATWNEPFDASLVWGSAIGNWNFLQKLGTYFHDDVTENVDQSEANWAWCLIVAGVLRQRDWDEMKALRKKIEKSRAKNEQLLLQFLEAILFGSDDQLATASKEYWQFFKKTDGKKKELFAPLAFYGNFLLRFAEKMGRQVSAPANVEDHLIRL